MNRRTVIFLGVVLFLLLAIFCLLIHAKKIETKLTERATAELKTTGLNGVTVQFDGRTAILSGTVPSDEALDKITALIGGLDGVRSVTNELTVEASAVETAEENAVEAPKDSARLKVNLQDLISEFHVNFATNSSQLEDGTGQVLEQVFSLLNQYTDPSIEIGGHADSRGSHDFNQALSLRRAESVKSYLKNNGVSSARLKAVGYGETKPIAGNATVEGMRKNRRVEFKVAKED